MHAVPDGQRGDFGTFILKKGMTREGPAFDAQGKPLAGMFVKIERDRGQLARQRDPDRLAVADAIERRPRPTPRAASRSTRCRPACTWSSRSTIGMCQARDGSAGRCRASSHRRNLTITGGRDARPIEIRATPHVVIEGGWVDSKGKPRRGSELMIIGQIDGESWHTHGPSRGGWQVLGESPARAGAGPDQLFHGSITSTRYRIGKGEQAQSQPVIMFGTLDHDVKDLEIVRYDAPVVIVKATTKDGRPLKDVDRGGQVHRGDRRAGFQDWSSRTAVRSEILFDTAGRRPVPLGPAHARPRVEDHRLCRRFKPASRTLKTRARARPRRSTSRAGAEVRIRDPGFDDSRRSDLRSFIAVIHHSKLESRISKSWTKDRRDRPGTFERYDGHC